MSQGSAGSAISLQLDAGDNFIQLRRIAVTGQDVTFMLQDVLFPNGPESPTSLGNGSHLLDTSDTGGAFWIELSLSSGQTLIASTDSDQNTFNEIDTLLELALVGSNEVVSRNDDDEVRSTMFSTIQFVAPVDGIYLLKVLPYDGDFFEPNVRFRLNLRSE
jgi:hypothetical protein